MFYVFDKGVSGLKNVFPEKMKGLDRFHRGDFRVAVFGQVLDASATAIALAHLSFWEQHPVVRGLVEYLGSAYWFIPFKAALIFTVLWFMDEEFESENTGLFYLLLLAVIVVGLAPGVRDVVLLAVS